MQNLTKASGELFRRQPDECFESLTALSEHCRRQKEACVDRWVPPRSIQTNPADAGRLMLAAGDDGAFAMNAWSFGQLCRLAGVAKVCFVIDHRTASQLGHDESPLHWALAPAIVSGGGILSR